MVAFTYLDFAEIQKVAIIKFQEAEKIFGIAYWCTKNNRFTMRYVIFFTFFTLLSINGICEDFYYDRVLFGGDTTREIVRSEIDCVVLSVDFMTVSDVVNHEVVGFTSVTTDSGVFIFRDFRQGIIIGMRYRLVLVNMRRYTSNPATYRYFGKRGLIPSLISRLN